MPVRSPHRKGFTLIELMTAVAIIAVLAALAVTLMVYGVGRARMNNASFELAAMMAAAQMSAPNRGVPNYLILYQRPGGPLRVALIDRPDSPALSAADWGNLDLSHLAGLETNPADSTTLTYQRNTDAGVPESVQPVLLDQLELAVSSGVDSGGISFLDLDSNRIERPLPRPFNTIPLESSGTAADLDQATPDLLAGCSFCVSANGVAYGVLRFNTNSTVEILTGPSRAGGSIAFMPSTQSERGFAYKLLVISAPSGIVHTYSEDF